MGSFNGYRPLDLTKPEKWVLTPHMTERDLDHILEELSYIKGRAKILTASNAIERQELRRLLRRVEFIEYHLDHSKPLLSERPKLRLICS